VARPRRRLPPARDTAAKIAAAGFAIERCERFRFRASALEPAVPYILGTARPPNRHAADGRQAAASASAAVSTSASVVS
jgi:hypothetical protein